MYRLACFALFVVPLYGEFIRETVCSYYTPRGEVTTVESPELCTLTVQGHEGNDWSITAVADGWYQDGAASFSVWLDHSYGEDGYGIGALAQMSAEDDFITTGTVRQGWLRGDVQFGSEGLDSMRGASAIIGDVALPLNDMMLVPFTLGQVFNVAYSAGISSFPNCCNQAGSGMAWLVANFQLYEADSITNVPYYLAPDEGGAAIPTPGTGQGTTTPAETPEPSALLLLGSGIVVLASKGLMRRFRTASK